MKLKWNQAPVKTQWGHDMVVADVAIDKDHTVSLYCEREQTAKVETMFAQSAGKQWIGLTDEELEDAWPFVWRKHESVRHFAIYHAIEAKLKEKNGF